MEVLISTQLFGWLGFGAFVAYIGVLAAYDTARHIHRQMTGDSTWPAQASSPDLNDATGAASSTASAETSRPSTTARSY